MDIDIISTLGVSLAASPVNILRRCEAVRLNERTQPARRALSSPGLLAGAAGGR